MHDRRARRWQKQAWLERRFAPASKEMELAVDSARDPPPSLLVMNATTLATSPHSSWHLRLRRGGGLPTWVLCYCCLLFAAYGSSRHLDVAEHADVAWWLTFTSSVFAAACMLLPFAGGLWLSKRFRIRRGQLRVALGVHAIAGAVVWLPIAVHGLVFDALGAHATSVDYSALEDFLVTFAVYAAWVGGVHCVMYIRESKRVEARAIRLQTELSEAARQRLEAELRALKSELSPRFMIEAFEMIQNLIRIAPDRAEDAVAQLGEVVRTALRRGSTSEVPLHEEIELLKPALELERVRLGALHVELHVDDGVLDALVPDLVLHPLVSIALEGLAGQSGTPRLVITARRDTQPGFVDITVMGSGTRVPDTPAPDQRAEWQAMVRHRLAQMYGERSSFTVAPTSRDGCVARLLLPYHEIEQPVASPEPCASPTVPLAPARGVIRGLCTLSGAVCWYVYLASTDVRSEIARHLYGVRLPRFLFELQWGVSACILTLTTVVAIRISRRFAWSDATIPTRRKLLPHVRAMLGLSALLVAEKALLSLPFGIVADTSMRHIALLIFKTAYSAVFVYTVSAGMHYLIVGVWRRLRAQRGEVRLEAEMNETVRCRAAAELRALQAELSPHFLGNALHAVAGLIRVSPDQAIHVLGQLSQVLRAPLVRSGAYEVSLAEELAMLHPYLEVERARIRRPLPVRWNVEHEALRGRVPQMILQPLVENAVKHGLGRGAANATAGIEVRACRKGPVLEIAVADDGCGLDARVAPRGAGSPRLGVANTRARLRELYGDRATFELASRPEGGTMARISVPWHEEPLAPVSAIYRRHVDERVPA
jgi:two-component system LytT family sensor kinase